MTDLRNLLQSLLALYGFGRPAHRRRRSAVQIGRTSLG